jgi:hypothetical protein
MSPDLPRIGMTDEDGGSRRGDPLFLLLGPRSVRQRDRNSVVVGPVAHHRTSPAGSMAAGLFRPVWITVTCAVSPVMVSIESRPFDMESGAAL